MDILANKRSLVVLAAGVGSRYGGLKQLDPLGPNGESILDYSIYDAARAGFTHVVFVIRPETESLFQPLCQRFPKLTFSFAYQEISNLPAGFTAPPSRLKPWGTGHALLVAAPYVHGPFGMVNADDFYGAASYQLLANFLQKSAAPTNYAMVGYPLVTTLSPSGPVSRGVCQCTKDLQLEQIVERTKINQENGVIATMATNGQKEVLAPTTWVSMNMWAFHDSLFAHLESHFRAFLQENSQSPSAEFFLPAVVNSLLQTSQCTVQILPTAARWFGLTYREDKAAARALLDALISNGEYSA